MELLTESNVEIKSTTKVFEGTSIESREKADKYALERRSYVFGLFKNERHGNRTVKIYYGFGVPN